MSIEQTPTTDIADVDLIKRRDLVTFAVVAYVRLTIEPLMQLAARSTIDKGTSDSAQSQNQQDSLDPEWKWWEEEGVDNQWEVAWLRFDDVSWSKISE
jgi:hypothetical protein